MPKRKRSLASRKREKDFSGGLLETAYSAKNLVASEPFQKKWETAVPRKMRMLMKSMEHAESGGKFKPWKADAPRERCMRVANFAEQVAKNLDIASFSFEASFLGSPAKDRSWSDLESVCIVAFFRVMTWLNKMEGYGIAQPHKDAPATAAAAEPASQQQQ